jgi:cytochrome b involved in lipid metabolism
MFTELCNHLEAEHPEFMMTISNMKKTLRRSIAPLLILPLLAAGCSSAPLSSTAAQGGSSPSPSPATTYMAADVAKHSTPDDCWMIVNGNVYNLTSYLNQHPGGPDKITPYCGKDATQPFSQKPNGQPHSQRANDVLASLQVGVLAK